jgi:IS4 transposase
VQQRPLEALKKIEKKDAYYISRLKSEVIVYESKDATTPLDLAKYLDQRCSQGILDVEIFVGKEKHPVRLISCKMTEEAINKRQRQANRCAQRHGTKVSKKKASLLKYCIFITNVPKIMLSSTSVMAVYRARWRVELIFKQWKSCLKLHLFKGYNKERFHCLLYGRLIMILLLSAIYQPLMLYAFTIGRELSGHKLANYLIADHVFARALQEGKIDVLVTQLLEDVPRRLCMDKRKRQSLRNNVRLDNSYYNQQEMNELQENAA